MWVKYKTKNTEGMLCISEIRNIVKVNDNEYQCWFKNINSYQTIDKEAYNKVQHFMVSQTPDVSKRNFLI